MLGKDIKTETLSISFQIKKERMTQGALINQERLYGDGPYDKESAIKALDILEEHYRSGSKDVKRPNEAVLRVDKTTLGPVTREDVFKIEKVEKKKIIEQ